MDLPRPRNPHQHDHLRDAKLSEPEPVNDSAPSNTSPTNAGRTHAGPTHAGPVSTCLRKAGVPDVDVLIGLVPHLLGFHPQNGTVVFVFLDRTALVLCGHLRVRGAGSPPGDGHPDILRETWRESWGELWSEFEALLTGRPVDSVVLIGYLNRDWGGELQRLADAAPVAVRALVRVDAGRRWRLDCPDLGGCCDPGCAPSGARIGYRSDRVAELIATDDPPAASLDDLTARLRPGPEQIVAAVAACLPLAQLPTPQTLHRSVEAEYVTRAIRGPSGSAGQQGHGRWQDSEPWSPEQAALLIQALADPLVRDHCAAWIDDAALKLWLDLILYGPPGWVAPVACLIATTAYQRGDSILTRLAIECALADSPGHGLARLLDAMLQMAVPPEALTVLIATALTLHPIDPGPSESRQPDPGRKEPIHHAEPDQPDEGPSRPPESTPD